jgi:hypothetical protein
MKRHTYIDRFIEPEILSEEEENDQQDREENEAEAEYERTKSEINNPE